MISKSEKGIAVIIALLIAISWNVTADGVPPVADFTYSVNAYNVTFNASLSHDADGIIVNYTWDFGDGSVGYGMVVNHSYAVEGIYTVNLTVKDNQSMENVTSAQVIIDVTPPVSHMVTLPSSPNGAEGWYVTELQFWFNASDNLSGVKNILYRINDGNWTTFDSNVSINKEGIYNISYYAIDAYGNEEEMHNTTLKVDLKPPSTLFNTSKNASDGWYSGEVEIKLMPYDSMSGVKTLYYRLDDGVYAEYEGSISVGEGFHVLEYFAVDNAGNAEELVRKEINVDSTPPSVDITPYNGIYFFGRKIISSDTTIVVGNITVEAMVSDVISGVKEAKFYVDGEFKGKDSVPPYQWLWDDFSLGSHEIKVVAYDNAGNKEEKEVTVLFINPKISNQISVNE